MPSPVVDLLGIICNSTADADGTVWNIEKMPGWQSPDVRVPTLNPTGAHGIRLARSWFGGRIVEAVGSAEATSYENAWAAYERISNVAPLEATADLIVYEPVPKFLTVALGDIPRVSEPSPSHVIEFSLVLVSEYAFKRVLDATTVALAAGGSATFTAGGKKPAEFEVTTTSTGTVELSSGGLTLSTYSLPSGSVISSMPGRRGITGPSGEDLSSSLVPGYQWPAIVPGSNTVDNAGSAAVSLSFYDSFA